MADQSRVRALAVPRFFYLIDAKENPWDSPIESVVGSAAPYRKHRTSAEDCLRQSALERNAGDSLFSELIFNPVDYVSEKGTSSFCVSRHAGILPAGGA